MVLHSALHTFHFLLIIEIRRGRVKQSTKINMLSEWSVYIPLFSWQWNVLSWTFNYYCLCQMQVLWIVIHIILQSTKLINSRLMSSETFYLTDLSSVCILLGWQDDPREYNKKIRKTTMKTPHKFNWQTKVRNNIRKISENPHRRKRKRLPPSKEYFIRSLFI